MPFLDTLEASWSLLKGAGRDYRAAFKGVLLLAFASGALVASYMLCASFAISRGFATLETISLASVVWTLCYLLVSVYFMAAFMRFIRFKASSADEGKGLPEALRVGFRRYAILLATLLIPAVLGVLPLLPFEVFGDALNSMGATVHIASVAARVLIAGLLAWGGIRLCLAIPACLYEEWGPLRSLLRGFVLSSGNFFFLFPAFLAAFVPLALLYRGMFIAELMTCLRANGVLDMPLVLGISVFAIKMAYCYLFALLHRAYLQLSGEE
jgi:hypothetical protein